MSEERRCCPVDTTVAKTNYTPQGDDMYMVGPLDAKAGVVLIGDIFGMHMNTKHTADDIAKAGYLVIMPDFFGKEAWEESNYPPASFEDPAWVKFYTLIRSLDIHVPRVLRAIATLRKLGCQKVAALGLCWGSVLTMRLAADRSVDAASVAHPAMVTPEDISAVKTPLCLLTAMDDKDVPALEAAVRALPQEQKICKHYDHLRHGFFGGRFDFDGATAELQSERASAFQTLLQYYRDVLQ